MRVIVERELAEMRQRLITWDEDTAFVVVQEAHRRWPNSEDLWVTTAAGPLDPIEGVQGIQELAADMASWDLDIDIVARGIALYGMGWEQLTSKQSMAMEQLVRLTSATPDWADRLAPSFIWHVRSVVFGRPGTRVITALAALDQHYQPDGPVPEGMLRGLS